MEIVVDQNRDAYPFRGCLKRLVSSLQPLISRWQTEPKMHILRRRQVFSNSLLETERLVLRQFTLEDVDNLVELNSDPEVVRFTPDQQVGQAIIQTQVLPKWFLYYEEYDGYGFWAAVEKSSQAFMGWFHFRPAIHAPYFDPALANPDDIELGYRLRKASWGQGYVTEGSKALILKGFSELGAQRIISVALAANMASIRVLEKSGLKLEKQFFSENLGQAVVLYALNH